MMSSTLVSRLLVAALWLIPLVAPLTATAGDRHAVMLSRFGGICNTEDRSQSAFRCLIDELIERQALPTEGRRMAFIPTAGYAPSGTAPLAAQRAEFRATAEEKAAEFAAGTARCRRQSVVAISMPPPTTTTTATTATTTPLASAADNNNNSSNACIHRRRHHPRQGSSSMPLRSSSSTTRR